jgi:hypothetical protein
MGKVSTMAMGRTMELTTPSNTPAISRVLGVSMVTPVTHRVATQRPIATMAARIKKPSILPPSLRYAGSRGQIKARRTISRL